MYQNTSSDEGASSEGQAEGEQKKEGEQAQVTTDPMLSLGLKVAVVVLGGLVLYVNVFAGGGKGGGKKYK